MGCHYKCLIYTRMLFYVAIISIHGVNAYLMLSSFNEENMKNETVKNFYETQFFFFTCWNFAFQSFYAAFALFCDWASLADTRDEYVVEKKSALPECVSKLRDRMFTVIVWPGTLMVTTYFWSFYFYDRELLYPKAFDLVVTPLSNHIIHTLILPIAVVELILYPRQKPESHAARILAILGLELVYVLTMFYIHSTTGIWIYPLFAKLNKCPYGLVAVLGFSGLYLSFLYYGQYCISDVVVKVRQKIGQRFCRACRN